MIPNSSSAALKVSSTITPNFEAAEVLAPLTEWALNIAVSIPAAVRISMSHLAIVEDDTGARVRFNI